MSILSKLKQAGCRVSGVIPMPDGSITFVATNSKGAWTDDDKAAVLACLGLVAPILAPEQLEAAFSSEIELWLDATAQSAGFNNCVSAISYATSGIDLWKRQGVAFATWRDAVWQSAFTLLASVQAGTTPCPATADALIALLPQPAIPNS